MKLGESDQSDEDDEKSVIQIPPRGVDRPVERVRIGPSHPQLTVSAKRPLHIVTSSKSHLIVDEKKSESVVELDEKAYVPPLFSEQANIEWDSHVRM